MGKIQKLMTGTLVVSIIVVAAVLGVATLTKPPKVKNMDAGPTNYTMTEVSKHDTSDDCWLVISQRVYNVTDYIPRHPGGRRAITKRCGTEVTSIFTRIHSNRAWDLLANYKIGNLQKG